MNTAHLYYAPPSLYSQIARIVLIEAGIETVNHIVAPGPPHFSTYEPFYMKMNPGGTVPTLVVGDQIFDDSRKIIDWVIDLPQAKDLIPTEKKSLQVMNDWINKAYDLPEREFAYGTGLIKYVGRIVNYFRLKKLKSFKLANPEMEEIYTSKIADIETFISLAANPNHVANLGKKYDSEMDFLENHLKENPFILGEKYSLADAIWSITVARQSLLKRNPLTGRPYIEKWFHKIKSRPSYEAACVMQKFEIAPMIKMVKGDALFRKEISRNS